LVEFEDLGWRGSSDRYFGEALTQLKKRDPATAERITDHRKIISFRNVLIHGYAQIDRSRT
jgi:uncharacterized protein YutE (UPF0331/DUF86 family)